MSISLSTLERRLYNTISQETNRRQFVWRQNPVSEFTKTIIPFALVGYEVIITNSRYALVGYFITLYPIGAHGIIVIYSGYLHSNRENVFQVLASADHLQITSVHQECCNFLKREVFQFKLDVRSYCHICPITEKYGLREFREVAEKQMTLNYQNICENEEFLTYISTEKLVSFLCRDLDMMTSLHLRRRSSSNL